MNELQQSIILAIQHTADEVRTATKRLKDSEHLCITTIDKTLAVNLHLQKLLIRLGATLPKQGLKK